VYVFPAHSENAGFTGFSWRYPQLTERIEYGLRSFEAQQGNLVFLFKKRGISCTIYWEVVIAITLYAYVGEERG
jgi:hypothetical protein